MGQETARLHGTISQKVVIRHLRTRRRENLKSHVDETSVSTEGEVVIHQLNDY
jgi:hypothetical protein